MHVFCVFGAVTGPYWQRIRAEPKPVWTRRQKAAAESLAQGGGKRKGAFAIYLEPWHADMMDWLDLRKNHGKEENRCRDLFYGLWVNDLFMQVNRLPP